MSNVSSAIANASQAADLEMSQYISQMNDSDRMKYSGANASTALANIQALKNDRFSYLSEDLVGADNNIVSTAYYLTRTKDLKNIAADVDGVATKQVMTSDINTGILLRQNEINEWANSNKLDTLFFLQVLFICLTFISSLYFLQSKGIISPYLLNLLIVLTASLAIFVLITRARYTNVRRDNRYWSKLRYGHMKVPDMKVPEMPPNVAPVMKQVCTSVTVPPGSSEMMSATWGSFFKS